MNLHDARVPYLVIPKGVLALSGKTSAFVALNAYRNHAVQSRDAGDDRYALRRNAEAIRECVDKGVLIQTGDTLALVNLNAEDDRGAIAKRILIPAKFDYAQLSLTALKVIIALHAHARYSRTPFEFTATADEIAGWANVSVRGVKGKAGALQQLQAVRLIEFKKAWREGMHIRLLDPESGSWLSTLGAHHLYLIETMPVHERYRAVLGPYDKTGRVSFPGDGGFNGHSVMCPFCKAKGRTFRFNSTEDGDHWTCFNCHRSGDSRRLYARLAWKNGKLSAREELARALPERTPEFDALLASIDQAPTMEVSQ